MTPATPPHGAQPGRYQLQCASKAAAREWEAFCEKNPEAALAAYDRLTNEPLSRQVGRQFPLKGKLLKPFWELEASRADRVYYAVCLKTQTVMIAVRDDVHSGAAVLKLLKSRVSGDLLRVMRKRP